MFLVHDCEEIVFIIALGSATNLSLLELPFKLELQWKAPHAIKGVVTGYQVSYWDANNTTARVMNVDGTSASVYGVETETEYVFNVVPNTKNRPGELATISITTSFQPGIVCAIKISFYCKHNFVVAFRGFCSIEIHWCRQLYGLGGKNICYCQIY